MAGSRRRVPETGRAAAALSGRVGQSGRRQSMPRRPRPASAAASPLLGAIVCSVLGAALRLLPTKTLADFLSSSQQQPPVSLLSSARCRVRSWGEAEAEGSAAMSLWYVGALLSVTGSVASNLGINVQKYSFLQNSRLPAGAAAAVHAAAGLGRGAAARHRRLAGRLRCPGPGCPVHHRPHRQRDARGQHGVRPLLAEGDAEQARHDGHGAHHRRLGADGGLGATTATRPTPCPT